MKVVYKYQLEIKEKQHLKIQGFNGFLKVAEQNGDLYLWCIINAKDKSSYTAEINLVGTGNMITDNARVNQNSYFDSVLMDNGFVWHVFIK